MGKAANKKRRKVGHPVVAKRLTNRVHGLVQDRIRRSVRGKGVLFSVIAADSQIGQDMNLPDDLRICWADSLVMKHRRSKERGGRVSADSWAHKNVCAMLLRETQGSQKAVLPRGRAFRKMHLLNRRNPWVNPRRESTV